MSQQSSHSSRILQNIVESELPTNYHATGNRRNDYSNSGSYTEQLSQNYSAENNDENQLQNQEYSAIEMVIDLDSQNSVTLLIRSTDNPHILAKKFCYSYNIDPKIINTLAGNIQKIQNTEFKEKEEYTGLIRKKGHQDQKQNIGLYSNTRTNDTGLNRSKLTRYSHHKHQTTTFNEENTIEDQNSGNWSSNLNRTTVFDRLYRDSQQKMAKKALSKSKMDLANTSMKKSIRSQQCAAQLRIYNKNTKRRQETLMKNQHIKNLKQHIDEISYTHVPEINPVSKLIAQKLKQINYDPSSKSKEKTLSKTINYLKQKELKSLEQCTFKPKILKRSQEQNIMNSDRFILLHQDHYLRQNKSQTLKANLNKKKEELKNPVINEISKKIIGGKKFEDRLDQYKKNYSKNKKRILDQCIRQQKFKPEINKPKTTKSSVSINRFEKLYRNSKSQQKNKTQTRRSLTNKNSSKIYEQNKRSAFRYIFTLMDTDEDGLISSLKINILGFQAEILRLLAPILCEMEDIGIQLDQEEFVQSMENLFQTYTIHEKNLILNVYKNPLRKSSIYSSQQPSFHPSLNEKSMEIARQVRQPGVSLYQFGRQKQNDKEKKLAQLRNLKAMLEYQQCSFQPNLFHHHF